MAQQYPDWIWQNGAIKPWQDATTHVMAHALHYGSSVFEGIRSYATPDGAAIFRLTDYLKPLPSRSRPEEFLRFHLSPTGRQGLAGHLGNRLAGHQRIDVQVLPDGTPIVAFMRLDLGEIPTAHHTLAIAQGFMAAWSQRPSYPVDAVCAGWGICIRYCSGGSPSCW